MKASESKGMGVVLADFDNDGWTDIAIAINNRGDFPELLRNDGGNANQWLEVLLIGTKSNRDEKDPIVDVRLFKNSNFASINVMFFAFGFLLLSGVVLLPLFLQTLMGYTAYIAGLVLSLAAFLLLFLMPLVGRLTTKFQARHLLAFGWLTMAVGMYISSKRLDLLISFSAATWMRVWQFLPVAFLMVPLTMAGYIGLPSEKASAAAGLMNFMRNIGMSVGTSAVTTLVVRRSQYHQSVLAEYTRSGRFQAAIEAMTARLSHAGFSEHDAHRQALGRLHGMLQRQASALS